METTIVELESRRKLEETERAYYKILEERLNQHSRFKHDAKEHLAVMQNLAQKENNEPESKIIICNSCDIEPKRNSKGHFVSRETTEFMHGFGVINIEKVVNKYNGISNSTYDRSSRVVKYTIVFPNGNLRAIGMINNKELYS